MNPDIFAEWLRRQGHQVYKTKSSYWFNAGPRVLQAFPYHWLMIPDEDEINNLLIENRILSLRYSSPINCRKGKISYHIEQKPPYELDLLKKTARNCVNKGLDRCKVKQISFERLAKEGWILQQDTLDRQNRLKSMTKNEWETLCLSAIDLPGFETWAAEKDGELAAAVINCRIDDTWSVLYALSDRRFLPDCVNNALFFVVSSTLLTQHDIKKIFFTVQSLDAPASVDEFKLRMGFQPLAVKQIVDFHPAIGFMANTFTHKILQLGRRLKDDDPLIAKAEGMLRFYLQGKKPIQLQDWPECLLSRKHEEMKGCHDGEKERS